MQRFITLYSKLFIAVKEIHSPTYIHDTCLLYDHIFVSAGQRDLQMKIETADLVEIMKAETVDVA